VVLDSDIVDPADEDEQIENGVEAVDQIFEDVFGTDAIESDDEFQGFEAEDDACDDGNDEDDE
jgi:hypothetical protein